MSRHRPSIVSLVVVLAAALLLPATDPSMAHAQASFTFRGSGWGHGLGMSQYGALGLAQKGWGHKRILRHFYSRTQVRRISDPPARIRVGLLQSRDQVGVRADGGRVTLRLGGPNGTVVGRIAAGETWTVSIRQGRYRITDADGRVVGGRLWGGPSRHLFARFGSGARAFIPQTGHAYGRGFLEFNLYGCTTCAKELRLIAVVPTERYLYGLGEVPSSWPMAALRAQAVAGRSYAISKVRALGQNRPECNCGLYATVSDQVYVGWSKEAGPDGSRWVKAVNDTARQVVLHGGEVIQAFYSSSSGGHTEHNENVWGGAPIPYLRGVCDPGDFTASNPNRVWSQTMTAEAVTAGLRLGIGTVTRFAGATRGVSGRIVSIVVHGTNGSATISGGRLRSKLSLRSERVWINANRNVTGDIRARYDAVSCRPGLPTTGQASVPGGSRQRFQVGAIYRNANAGTAFWLRGPIYDTYRQRDESAGVLGMARSGIRRIRPKTCDGTLCQRASFVGGNIYFKRGLGAFALWGPVLRTYLDKGGAFGRLGMPTSDVRWIGDGRRRATFERGTITCGPGGACRVT